MCGWKAEELFDVNGDEPCWRGDHLKGKCRECEGKGEPDHGVIYGVLHKGRLVYVGSSYTTIQLRHERAWVMAFEPRCKSYHTQLSRAMRESPDRSDWSVVMLQADVARVVLEACETAWMMKSSAPGACMPPLNDQFAKVKGMCMWSDLGDRVALHLEDVPQLTRSMFDKLRRNDPEALKRVYKRVR